ncbi:MAG: hypothetical protein K6C99_06160 [Lachnospiraceae bacterium]|nr:hypothetical protein [Lachnospiraceae bacterium]
MKRTVNRCICIFGASLLALTACGKKETENSEPVEVDLDLNDEDKDVQAANAGEAAGANSEDDMSVVVTGIEGIWGTAHVPQDIRVFAEGEESLYNAVIDPETGDVSGYQQVETRQIASVEKTSDSEGECYKIFMSEDDVIYYWYPDRPDDLEYHWEPDGYSASDSLIRQAGATMDDYKIVDTTSAGSDAYDLFYDFAVNPYEFEWDGLYHDRYVYDGVDYGWKDFALVDLDGDGNEELIATNTDGENRPDAGMQSYLIAYCKDGKFAISELADGVASAGGYRGTKCYLPGRGIIYDDSFSAPYGAPAFCIYRLKDGVFEYSEEGYLSPAFDYDYPECLEKGEWHVGDKTVTEEEYKDEFNRLTDNNSGIALGEIEYISRDEMLDILSSHDGN